jgi:hypothetical protein
MITKKYNYLPVNRDTVDGKRYYCLPDGSKVSSVTTILDKTKSEESKQALQNWRNRVGHAQAQQITTEAAGRGTRMHKWIENYVNTSEAGAPGSNPYSQQSFKMAKILIDQGLKNTTEFWGVEVPLYYSGLYAGTSDCIGVWGDRPAILDFKQTNKPKKIEWIEDYFLQLTAYALAHNNMFGTDIKTGVILMCSADYQYQEFVLTPEVFDRYATKWLDRVEKYYLEN